MAFFDWFKTKTKTPDKRSESPDETFDRLRGIEGDALLFSSGQYIDRDKMAAWSAVGRAVDLISGAVADAVVDSLRVATRKEKEQVDAPFAERACRLLTDSPDDMQPAHQFVEDLMTDYLASGNAVVRVAEGANRKRLELLQPSSVDVQYSEGGETEITGIPDSTLDGEAMLFKPREIAIVRWSRLAGRSRGLSARCRYLSVPPVQSVSKAVETALLAENYARKYFAGKGEPGAVHSDFAWLHPEDEDPEAVRNAMDVAMGRAASGNRYPLPLPGGQIVKLSSTPQDADLLKLREFQLSEIGRVYGVPPALMWSNAGGSPIWGSSLAELARFFRLYGTRLHMNRMLESLSFRLLPRQVRFEIDDSRLLRGDVGAVSTLITASKPPDGGGVFSRSELRSLFGIEREYVDDWDAAGGGDSEATEPDSETESEGGEPPSMADLFRI